VFLNLGCAYHNEKTYCLMVGVYVSICATGSNLAGRLGCLYLFFSLSYFLCWSHGCSVRSVIYLFFFLLFSYLLLLPHY